MSSAARSVVAAIRAVISAAGSRGGPSGVSFRVGPAEADPDGGVLAARYGLAPHPNLTELAGRTRAGLRPTEVDGMVGVLREINREHGTTIVLIEHVMRAVMALAGRVLVLHHGARIALGTPAEVVAEPEVVRSYLGTGPVH